MHSIKCRCEFQKRLWGKIVLLFAMIFLVCFALGQAQAQTCYIIVHALNPEQIEIASIEGMVSDCVEIYDGDTLIGYGAHDEETYNKPIAISPGEHTIKVKFNGMTLIQNINLLAAETRVLKFVFDRTNFDLKGLINQNAVNDSRSVSGSLPPWEGPRGYLEREMLTPDIEAFLYTLETSTAYRCGISYSISWQLILNAEEYYNRIQTTIDLTGWSSLPAETRTTSVVWNKGGVRDGRNWPNVVKIPVQTFFYWFIQSGIVSGSFPNIDFAEKDNPYNYVTFHPSSYTLFLLSASKAYRKANFSIGNGADAWVKAPDVSHNEFDYVKSGSCSEFTMASVPFDLAGTGIKYEPSQTPTASFVFSPEGPVISDEIIFDASTSSDPDGTIVKYEWDFGDGNTAEGEVVSHVYTEADEYTVTLTVEDDDGLTSSDSILIVVGALNQPPVASFTYSEQNQYEASCMMTPPPGGVNLLGKKVIIDISSSYDPDGTITETYFTVEGRYIEENPGWPAWSSENDDWTRLSAYFPREDYEVTLHVRDNDGLWSQTTQTIQINLPPCLIRKPGGLPPATVISSTFYGFEGPVPESLTFWYKHDGEYYIYSKPSHLICMPNSKEWVYFTNSLYGHEIQALPPEHVPEDHIPLGYIKYREYYDGIEQAEGLGEYIALTYAWCVYRWRHAGPEINIIRPSEIHFHHVNIDSNSEAIFSLQWPGSDLDLVLYTPSDTRIDPAVAAEDENVDYYKGDTYAYYKVYNAATGIWTMEVIARDVPQEGEEYTIVLGLREIPSIDIDPDTLNLKSKGKWMTCYIEFRGAYDVNQIDVETVTLSYSSSNIYAALSPTEVADYDNDGMSDLMVKFDREAVQDVVSVGEVEMRISGSLIDGTRFQGADSMLVIDKGKEHINEGDTSSVVY